MSRKEIVLQIQMLILNLSIYVHIIVFETEKYEIQKHKEFHF